MAVPKTDVLVPTRCKVCNNMLCEISEGTIGTVHIKCKRCKRIAKLTLPLKNDAKIVSSNLESSGVIVYA